MRTLDKTSEEESWENAC